jgi:hypothetical protein
VQRAHRARQRRGALSRLPDRLSPLPHRDRRQRTPEEIRSWYLDGWNYFTVRSNEVDATTWANATDHGFILILNVAMGGSFPAAFGGGPTDATASGVPMLIDYVRVYERGQPR